MRLWTAYGVESLNGLLKRLSFGLHSLYPLVSVLESLSGGDNMYSGQLGFVLETKTEILLFWMCVIELLFIIG